MQTLVFVQFVFFIIRALSNNSLIHSTEADSCVQIAAQARFLSLRLFLHVA
jgi:hypothetical protein